MSSQFFLTIVQEILENVQIAAEALSVFLACVEAIQSQKRIWVNEVHQKRNQFGLFHTLFSDLAGDGSLVKFIRVDTCTFSYICDCLRERLFKSSSFRECLSVEEKVFTTLL